MKYTDHPREIETKTTPLTFEQARDAAALGFFAEFGAWPTIEALACFLAQMALETGRFQRGLRCYNFGNVKASASYSGYHQYFWCNEVYGGVVRWFYPEHGRCRPEPVTCKAGDPPHPENRFRAYPTAADGMRAHFVFLGRDTTPHNGKPNRYQRAFDAALMGDPGEFARELGRAGYYTASPDSYVRAVIGLFREYVTKLDGWKPDALATVEQPDMSPDEAIHEDGHSRFSEADLSHTWASMSMTAHQMLGDFWNEEFTAGRNEALRSEDGERGKNSGPTDGTNGNNA